MSGEQASAATNKAIERLGASIDSGDLYQALQIFKTQHSRAKKKGDIKQATELAFRGAKLMLEKGEVNSGSELSRDFVDLLKSQPDVEYDKMVQDLVALDLSFDKLTGEEAARERKRFLKACIDFTKETGHWTMGEPAFHHLTARVALKQQDVMTALKHFVLSAQPEELATTLVAWAKAGPPDEVDLHLARAVLQILCFENLRDANIVRKSFMEAFPELDTPLTRFLGFLLKTLERDAYPLFQTLRNKYAQSLAREKSFESYMERIAQVFYGVAPQKSGMASMVEQFMKNMF